jgi:hypothetical protein
MKSIGIAVALALVAVGGLAPVASAATGDTTITMKVTGCNGCTITPVQAITGAADSWTGTPVKVSGGQAVLTVPTTRTPGMSFNLEASWQVDINAMPVIVTQYQGRQPGQAVTKRQAMAARQATACWAGTADPAVTIRVTVRRVMLPAFPDGQKKTRVPLAWMVPTAQTTGGFSPTQKGVIAQQNAWYCPAA